MTTGQTDFVRALLDPSAGVPAGLMDPAGRPAGKRFDVYRNNVVVSLTDALEAGFPVLRKLLGEANFRGLAGLFLRRHPPQSPLLMHYGAPMPAFLESFGPLKHLPYLADVARLELALRAAYHAADASPVDPSTLGALSPEALTAARLRLAPSVMVLSSAWPILGIWRRNTEADAPKPDIRPEDVLVVRPEFDPIAVLLPPGGAVFVTALMDGQTVGEALDHGSSHEGFDLGAILSALIANGAIVSLEETP